MTGFPSRLERLAMGCWLVVGLILAPPHLSAAATEPPADLALLGGKVYTLDAARSWAEAVVVRDRRLVYVGSDEGAKVFLGPETRVIQLDGKMVLPGFHDSHVHLVSGGVELGQCDLNGAASREEVFERVRAYARANPTRAWIVGGGWNLPLFPKANATKEELDALVGDRPAYLTAADGHSVWVSSKALAIAGITKATPDPPQGRIERDPATGEPTGTLREAAADLVSVHLPKISPAERQVGLAKALRLAYSFGITSAIEASASEPVLEAYRALEARGELAMRVTASLYVDSLRGVEQVPELVARRDSVKGLRRLKATAVKMFADGVIESGTAALLAPYLGRKGSRGELNFEPKVFAALATALDKAGFQIHIHAIGDRAIRESLNALEAARTVNGARDSRHHLAHIQLFDPSDIPRFQALGITANFQPLWAYADPYITELTEPVLGPERSRWLYPLKSLAASGARLAAGSDWSVSSLNPLEAIEVAITRRDPSAGPGPAWRPEETVDLATILAAYTSGGAWLTFQEKNTGSLEAGKAADLIVLDRNLFTIPPQEISDTKVLLTLIAGEEVWRVKGW